MKAGYAVTGLLSLLSLAAVNAPSPALADEAGIKVGILTCEVASGWGLVFGSSRNLKCAFTPDSKTSEHYTGKIMKFGVDLGYTQSSVIVWTVLSPSNDVGKGALAGDYVGATGSAAVGAGAGANVLVGGGPVSISLEPVSFQGGTGLNVAAGIASITLKAAK